MQTAAMAQCRKPPDVGLVVCGSAGTWNGPDNADVYRDLFA